ncbi:MAG: hypothetical protein HEQ32_06915 [Vampirovibrio sp.]
MNANASVLDELFPNCAQGAMPFEAKQSYVSSIDATASMDVLLENIRKKTNPFDKLKEAVQQLPLEIEALEEAQAFLDASDYLGHIPEAEQNILRRSLLESFKHERAALSEEALKDLDFELPPPPDTDDYLVKTTTLIARKVAAILNRDRFVHDVFQTGDLQMQKHILVKHLLNLLNENQALKKDLQASQNELARYYPSGLGLFKRKKAPPSTSL